MSPLFEDLAGELAARHQAPQAAPHAFLLRIEELALRVRSNSAAVRDDLRAYFGAWAEDDAPGPADLEFLLLDGPVAEPPVELALRPPAPGKRPDKERAADLPGEKGGGRLVRKQATGMLFLFGQGWNMALGPCAENRNQLVNFLCARYMERRVGAGWMLGHAAGVAREGLALALCGFSGMGKSTLALRLAARGLDFVSNDRVLVQPPDLAPGRAPVLHGIPKHPRLNPGTALGDAVLARFLARALPQEHRRACAGLGPEALRAVELKFDARIEDCFGPPAGSTRFVLCAPLAGVAVLNWRHGGGACLARRVDLRTRPDLLAALRKKPGVFYLPESLAGARLSEQDCLEALGGVPALELTGGSDFAAAERACLELLG